MSLCEKMTSPVVQLAFNKKKQSAVTYGCRDVAIILKQPKLKIHRVSIPPIMSTEVCSNQCLFSKAKVMKNSNHEVLGL